MKRSTKLILTLLFVILVGTFTTGCGSSSGGEGSSTGPLIIDITDAPIDGATHVIVQFSGVEVKLASGEKLNFDFDSPKQIDLLALKSGITEFLLGEENLPAGHYNWIRLKVDAELGVLDSYIELDDGSIFSLWIPSGSQTGLKLVQGFDMPVGGYANFTIDFNLRKSVHNPSGIGDNYILKPALRIVDNTMIGSIAGTVDSVLINDPFCKGGNEVYVFEGHSVVPDDVDEQDAEPITTAKVELDSASGQYEYRAAFLNAGEYTIAFTCDSEEDLPGTDDIINFIGTANVSVSAGMETLHNFQ